MIMEHAGLMLLVFLIGRSAVVMMASYVLWPKHLTLLWKMPRCDGSSRSDFVLSEKNLSHDCNLADWLAEEKELLK